MPGLKTVRLELARNPEFPEGSASHGYEFKAPLDDEGHLDGEGWKQFRQLCTVRRFWGGGTDEVGLLVRLPGGRWVFSYAPGDEDDEAIFRFDRHRFVPGEYVSITEHDGDQRTFKVVAVR
ncbi:MAG: hypothetical protein OHK0024_17040 [Thalassobaculales bacterium]